MGCDRPVYAPFICEVQIPDWARNETNGCLLTALPSVSIIYVLEDDVFELVSDCGFQHGTKSVSCKDPIDQNLLIKQLKCDFDEENMIDRDNGKKPAATTTTTTTTTSTTVKPTITTITTKENITLPSTTTTPVIQQPYWSSTMPTKVVTRTETEYATTTTTTTTEKLTTHVPDVGTLPTSTDTPELKQSTTEQISKKIGTETTTAAETVTTTVSSNSPPTPTLKPTAAIEATESTERSETTPNLFIATTTTTTGTASSTTSTSTSTKPATTSSPVAVTATIANDTDTKASDTIQDYLEIRPNFEQELVDDKIIEINVSLNDETSSSTSSNTNETSDNDPNKKSAGAATQIAAIRNLTIIETNSNRSAPRKREIKPYFVSRLIG